MIKDKVYKKLNSFQEFKAKNFVDYKSVLSRIKVILKEKKKLNQLNSSQLSILENVKKDIFEENKDKKIKFNLSKHVLEEIQSLDDSVIPLYLVHRYRYEIFPELKIIDEYPPYLQIEPSSVCNYRCVFCFETDDSFTNKKNGYMGSMKLDLFKKVIDEAENNIQFISIASRGEPLVCKEISQMLEYTKGKFINLKLNTNASLLNEENIHAILSGGVKTLVFSADAADKKTYAKLRVNGSLEKVLKNIKLFKKIKEQHYSKSKIITRVSGVKFNNEQNIESMNNLWSELVDQVAFVDYNPWEDVYSRKSNKIPTPCSDLWRRMFIWWDGKANPCDTDYKSNLNVGNFKDVSLSSLWKSLMYQELRKGHLANNRKKFSPCGSCVVI